MAFRTVDRILEPDPRFADLVADSMGLRDLRLIDHHAAIAEITLKGEAPQAVRDAFDRARNILLYAWFDYDLLVIGEIQAFAAFELALKLRLNTTGSTMLRGLGKLIHQARKEGVLPASASTAADYMDPIELLRHMRNALAHGTTDVHTPAMALDATALCARAIDIAFPRTTAERE